MGAWENVTGTMSDPWGDAVWLLIDNNSGWLHVVLAYRWHGGWKYCLADGDLIMGKPLAFQRLDRPPVPKRVEGWV